MRRWVIVSVGVGVVAVLLVAVPSLLRLRVSSSGESPQIGDTRAVISAMAAYQSVNQGYVDGQLSCLSEPSRCVPGYGAGQPTFLDSTLTSLAVKNGYVRTWHAGPPAPADEIATRKASQTSALCYAYVTTPASRDTGVRSFCGDCTGRICWYGEGVRPTVKDGYCDPCQALQ